MKSSLTTVKSPKQTNVVEWFETTNKNIENADLSRFEMLYSLFYNKPSGNIEALVTMKALQENFDWKDGEVFKNYNRLTSMLIHLGRMVKKQETPTLFKFATFSKLLKKLKRETGDDLIKEILNDFYNNGNIIAFVPYIATPSAATRAA